MSDLTAHLADYLRMRRALGFKLTTPGIFLPQLIAYVRAAGAENLTSELMISWARLPAEVQPIHWAHRLGAARGFARYLQTVDVTTEVPPVDVFGARQRRRAPYLWSELDIVRLLQAAHRLQPELRAASCEAFFGLLAVSGMRIGEAAGLDRNDVDLTSGVVTIREGKFGRSRIVPLHESAVSALTAYGRCRDRLRPEARSQAFFIQATGVRLSTDVARNAFNQIITDLGLHTSDPRPRLHDLRHTFAVRTLIEWHRSGADVDARMTGLSNYLGHVNPSGTYWYLSASPELMELAAARLDGHFGEPR